MTEILRYIGIGKETTFGTEATPAIHVDPGSISLDTPNNAEISVVGGMGRMVARKRAGYYCPQGNFEYATDLNTIGYLFRGILDKYVYTATSGVYKVGSFTDLVGGANTTIKAATPATAGTDEITVTSPTGIKAGDVLRVGNKVNDPAMEVVTVLSVSSDTLTLVANLKNDHDALTEVVEIVTSYSTKAGGASTTILAENDASDGDTHIDVTDATGIAEGDVLSIGTGATIEYRVVTTVADTVVSFTAPLAYDHPAGEAVVEVEKGGPDETQLKLHEFYGGNSPDLESFTIEAGKDVFEHVFLGCCFNTLTLSVDSGLVMANLGIVAQKDKSDTLKAIGDLTLTADYPLAFYEVLATVNSSDISANVTSCNLNFNNNIATDRGRHLGSRYPTGFKANARDITATIQMEFENKTYLDLFWGANGVPSNTGSALFPLVLTFNGGPEVGYMTVNFPNCYLESVTTQPSGRDSLIQTLNVRAMLEEDVTLADEVTTVDTDVLVSLYCDTATLA